MKHSLLRQNEVYYYTHQRLYSSWHRNYFQSRDISPTLSTCHSHTRNENHEDEEEKAQLSILNTFFATFLEKQSVPLSYSVPIMLVN